MTAAETLRTAARLMRERGEAATPGPWRVIGGGEYVTPVGIPVAPDDGGVTLRDAEHIASMHPTVALAVAQLLDDQAALIEQHGDFSDIEAMGDANALAVAHAYLNTQDTP